jgi:parallel beta-helix repeat protein
MSGNKYNLYVRGAVEGPDPGYFLVNEIDDSNSVNGNPVIYWINEHNRTVPTDAGYVALFNCTNITAQNLNISNNDQGIQLASTTNSTITQNTINANERQGIAVYGSNNNTISHNSITNTGDGTIGNFVASRYWEISHFENPGIGIYGSHNNIISGNYIAKNEQGIILWSSSENEITANNITENKAFGIRLQGNTTDNIIYHNSFIDNKVVGGLQVSIDKRAGLGLVNAWDNGTAGNYWSDYSTRYPNATEIGNTGVGDTPFYINPNNIDHHPVIEVEVIPEFPLWLILLLCLLTILVVTFYRKRLRRT